MTRLHWQRKIYSAVGSFGLMVRHHKQQRVRLQCWFDADSIRSRIDSTRKGNGSCASSHALYTRHLNIQRNYVRTISVLEVIRTTRLEVRLHRLSEGKCINSETIMPSTKEPGSDFSFSDDSILGISSAKDLFTTEFLDLRKQCLVTSTEGKAGMLQDSKPFSNTSPVLDIPYYICTCNTYHVYEKRARLRLITR